MNRKILILAIVSTIVQLFNYWFGQSFRLANDVILPLSIIYYIVSIFVASVEFISSFRKSYLKTRILNGIGTFFAFPGLLIIAVIMVEVRETFLSKPHSIENMRHYNAHGEEIPLDSVYKIIPKDTLEKVMKKVYEEIDNEN